MMHEVSVDGTQQEEHGRSQTATKQLDSLSESRSSSSVTQGQKNHRGQTGKVHNYKISDDFANLDEVAGPLIVDNPAETPVYRRHQSLEAVRNEDQLFTRNERERRASAAQGEVPAERNELKEDEEVSRFVTEFYTISYLILFSFFGTLARLGLQAITFYPGAPVVFSELWANVGGCLLMGFLVEDRKLFQEEWGTSTYAQEIEKSKQNAKDEETGSSQNIDLAAAKKAHAATKKTIPMYLGLTTGMCGCFTSFSSFARDMFLAMSNALPSRPDHPQSNSANSSSTISRNGGYSFMALLAVIITTVSLCISALIVGAHVSIAIESFTPSISFRFSRKIIDPFCAFLAYGCWLGAVLLAVFPPDRDSGGSEIWRGRAVFAIVFAPLGCLGRFYVSLWLNGRIASFPLGTFVVNVFGTGVLGMAWDIQHTPIGGEIGCQVLQGIEDGFCGCLTTVSTWVGELVALRRRHAYWYGMVSVVVGLCTMIVIMGSMQWTIGYMTPSCTH